MARKSKPERSSGNTVLVVDDSPEYLEATRLTLEREGHHVLTRPGGPEALEVLRTEHVDLVLLDYHMPGMTGEEVVLRLRQFKPHVPVVLQTGYASERPPRELLRKLDIQGYHDKGDGPDKLLFWTDLGLKGAYSTRLLNEGREGLAVDPLTGLYVRRFLEQCLDRELRTALRSPQPVAVVMLDIDRLRQVNDTAGHATGDRALALVGALLRQTARGNDVAARYGGDELALVLPNTGPDGAAILCKRLLGVMGGAQVEGPDGPVSVKVSLGYACLEPAAFAPTGIARPVRPEYFGALGRALLLAAEKGVLAARRPGAQGAHDGGPERWPPFPATSADTVA
jgi:diguanylate cyclase (GGDEF)-like protein